MCSDDYIKVWADCPMITTFELYHSCTVLYLAADFSLACVAENPQTLSFKAWQFKISLQSICNNLFKISLRLRLGQKCSPEINLS